MGCVKEKLEEANKEWLISKHIMSLQIFKKLKPSRKININTILKRFHMKIYSAWYKDAPSNHSLFNYQGQGS